MSRRPRRIFYITCMFLLVAGFCGCSSHFNGKEMLQVAVVTGSKEFNLASTSPIMIRETRRNRKLLRDKITKPLHVRSDPQGIRLGRKLYRVDGFTIITKKDGSINVDGTRYRGNFKVFKKDRLLWAVNYVNVEDYLRSVVPSEMSPAWDLEALKTQAIVSRSYALFHAIKNFNDSYHLTRTSQAYKGIEAEDPRSDKAVKSTQSKVIYYKKKLLLSYCSNACGGHTESPQNVWPSEYKSPRPVRCPYCKGSKNFRWSARIPSREIEKKLDIDHMYAFKPYKKSKASGRITELKFYHKSGNTTIRLNKFRQLLGYDVICSGYFSMEKQNGYIAFQGRGWGHGAGLCQTGAKKLAELGKNYKSIIRYYFPSTQIRRFRF